MKTERISLEAVRRELTLSGDDKPVILKVEIPEIKGSWLAGGADDFLVAGTQQRSLHALGVPGSIQTQIIVMRFGGRV